MNATSKSGKRISPPSFQNPAPGWKRLTGAAIERMLRHDGFKKIDPATRRRLIAAGHWGRPDE